MDLLSESAVYGHAETGHRCQWGHLVLPSIVCERRSRRPLSGYVENRDARGRAAAVRPAVTFKRVSRQPDRLVCPAIAVIAVLTLSPGHSVAAAGQAGRPSRRSRRSTG